MAYQAINIGAKFDKVSEHWSPRVMAELNDYQFKIAKLDGDFIWHSHPDTDEAFLVIDGILRLDFRAGAVEIGPGEMFVVREHRRRRRRSDHAERRVGLTPALNRRSEREERGR